MLAEKTAKDEDAAEEAAGGKLFNFLALLVQRHKY